MNHIGSQYGDPAAALAPSAKAEWSSARFADRESSKTSAIKSSNWSAQFQECRALSLLDAHRRMGQPQRLGRRRRHAILRAPAQLKCGIDMGAAREKVRTANALASLPIGSPSTNASEAS